MKELDCAVALAWNDPTTNRSAFHATNGWPHPIEGCVVSDKAKDMAGDSK